MSRRENGGEEMADWPEAAIQAILIGLLDMQQLNLNLAERLAVEALLEGEPQEERDQRGTNEESFPAGVFEIYKRPADFQERPGPLGRFRGPVPRGSPRLRRHGGASQEGVV